jgi:tight adherence protein C
MLLLAVAGMGAAFALLTYGVLAQMQEKATIKASLRQLEDYEIESIRDQELLAPIQDRVLLPVAGWFTGLGKRFTPQGYVEKVKKKLINAGKGRPEDLDRFLAIRVLTVAAIPVVWVVVIFFLDLAPRLELAVLGGAALFLVLGPDAILNRQVEERQYAIRVKLPDILDLLVISVEAGLGFEQALDRTVAAVPGPLSDEFARMLNEVRAGSSRAEAMRALDERINVTEVRSFVLAILQADTFGVSIGRVLRSLADEMRIKRRQLAQEQAQKAPVKMLIPMVCGIFPALFVVVIGPAIINISNNI